MSDEPSSFRAAIRVQSDDQPCRSMSTALVP
jgi:hypothetical protein